MPVSNGVSAHGTLIKRQGITIGELQEITPPALNRKSIETTIQNSSDDDFVVGLRRRNEMQLNINFLPSGESTHGFASGLMKAWSTGSKDLYEIDFSDGAAWFFSGFVTNIAPKAPVDGALSASVSIRPTGANIFVP